MPPLTTAPRGTKDTLPSETPNWQYLERSLLNTAELFGFREIRVPTFEHTELFLRSVGETTDVVGKEMYTFEDKGNRSLTLRPEGTAGVARAAIENGLLGDALPLKVSYLMNCFRYEKPQSGRFREFHQFGVELYGSTSPTADAEIISLVQEAYDVLGVQGIHVELNSIGCPTCRAAYHKALRTYFEAQKDSLCDTCHERLEKNPMRILDCKNPDCGTIAEGAPKMLDFLCGDCQTHFDGVKALLTASEIAYTINPTIVRGLDYYTRTVFEFVYTAQNGTRSVCGGGGRYGGLLKELGGPDYEGIGFAMGLERLLAVMTEQGCDFPPPTTCDVYLVSMGTAAEQKAFQLASLLRADGFFAQCDLMGRSLKAQMKYANKIGAKFTIVLGDNEIATQNAMLKSMHSGKTREIPLDSRFSDTIYQEIMDTAYADLEEATENLER